MKYSKKHTKKYKKSRKTRRKKLRIKAKGKSIKGNRQLSTFLKNQGTLSYKLDGKEHKLKINDDIVKKIDNILKDELEKQKNNKKEIVNKLKSFEKLLNIYNNDDELTDIVDEIKKIKELSIENFGNNSELEKMKKTLKKIKDDIIIFIEIAIENEETAQGELSNYENNSIEELEELLEAVNNSSP